MLNFSRRLTVLMPILFAAVAACTPSSDTATSDADSAAPVTDAAAPTTAAAAASAPPVELPESVDLNEFAAVYADVFLVQMRAQKLISAAIRAQDAEELAKLRVATERSVIDIVERHGMPIEVYKQTVQRLNQNRALSQQVADRVQAILKERGDLPADAPHAVVSGQPKGPVKPR